MLVRDVPLLGCLFRAENVCWVSFLVKLQVVIILGYHFRKITLWGIDFDQISLTWLKFWIAVTILGYKFSMAWKFLGILS